MTDNKQVSRWSDSAMFTAERSKAADGPTATLLGGPADPLGQIAASALMYTGQVVRDLSEVTDEQRRSILKDVLNTVLGMPLEGVALHFMIEGVTRGFTHQMVRQRTAAYAQESTRFAVKEDMKTAVALPPSLEGSMSLAEQAISIEEEYFNLGIRQDGLGEDYYEIQAREAAVGIHKHRIIWDDAVDAMGSAYLQLVNSGMPAEDARGLMPTNVTTRLNYITNLRNWLDTMAVRVSDQAQFEWRNVAMQMALAMRRYGATQSYWTKITRDEYNSRSQDSSILERRFDSTLGDPTAFVLIRQSSAWQYEKLTEALKPVDFKLGKRAFAAGFDRPSRIGERVDANASVGRPSSDWTTDDFENNIPAIHPEEWLLDPNSARLNGDQEFDIWGNRVLRGSGHHWVRGMIVDKDGVRSSLADWKKKDNA